MDAGGRASKQNAHIVLVHGACHGAWCWYKLKPLLEAAGHRVTALDMAASGIDPTKLRELGGMADYARPLLDLVAAVTPPEKVVLVGHSLGGANLGLAMEMFPEKISAAVFVAAFMPDYAHRPSYALEQYGERTSAEDWLDTEFLQCGTTEEPLTSMLFGPNFVSSKLYNLCSLEDVELAKALLRPSSMFIEDLLKKRAYTKERYGSVKRLSIVCMQDKGIPVNFQRWQMEEFGADKVMEIENADHMPMLSQPHQLCQCLLEIADTYA